VTNQPTVAEKSSPLYSPRRLSETGIVIPTYKEASNIAALVTALRDTVPGARIVVVDDSPDLSTVHALASLAGPALEVIHRSAKGGRGSAALEGLRNCLAAGAQTIVEMDADFSHSPAELPGLIAALRSNDAGMVVASRYLSDSRIVNWPLSRRAFSRLANILAKALLRVPIHDYTNGYRVYSRTAAEIIDRTCGRLGKGFIPLSEILVNLYYRRVKIVEVPTVFVNRARGESSVTASEIRNALVGLARIYGLKRKLSNSNGSDQR
jgi:dolichol-phosphate mannosyltransferase